MTTHTNHYVSYRCHFPATTTVMKAAESQQLEIPGIPFQPPAWALPEPERQLGQALIVLQRARNFADFVSRWGNGEPVPTNHGREYTDREVGRAEIMIWEELKSLGARMLASINHPLFQKLSHADFRPRYVAFGSRGPENEVDEIENGGTVTVGAEWVAWTPSERKEALAVLDELKQRDVLYRALRETIREVQEGLESICT